MIVIDFDEPMDFDFPESLSQLEIFYKHLPNQGYTVDICKMGPKATYGEITCEGIGTLFQCARKMTSEPLRTFLDLGSGTGKACVSAALFGPDSLERSLGIELSGKRTEIAHSAIASLRERAQNEDQEQRLDKLHLRTGDFLEQSTAWIACADVIWISNMCFPEEVYVQLALLIDAFAKENCIISASCHLPIARIESDCSTMIRIPQSWQPLHEVIVYKITGPCQRRMKELRNVSVKCPNFKAALKRAFYFWSTLDSIMTLKSLGDLETMAQNANSINGDNFYETTMTIFSDQRPILSGSSFISRETISDEGILSDRKKGYKEIEKPGSRISEERLHELELPANRVHNAVLDALLFLDDAKNLADCGQIEEALAKAPMGFSEFQDLCSEVARAYGFRRQSFLPFFTCPFLCTGP